MPRSRPWAPRPRPRAQAIEPGFSLSALRDPSLVPSATASAIVAPSSRAVATPTLKESPEPMGLRTATGRTGHSPEPRAVPEEAGAIAPRHDEPGAVLFLVLAPDPRDEIAHRGFPGFQPPGTGLVRSVGLEELLEIGLDDGGPEGQAIEEVPSLDVEDYRLPAPAARLAISGMMSAGEAGRLGPGEHDRRRLGQYAIELLEEPLGRAFRDGPRLLDELGRAAVRDGRHRRAEADVRPRLDPSRSRAVGRAQRQEPAARRAARAGSG